MIYLIDSGWLVDALGGITTGISTLARLRHQGLVVSVISLGEIFDGAFGTDDPEATLTTFRTFLSDYPTVPLSDPVVTTFARTRHDLRRQGRLIPDLDLLIAATALEHNLILLTRNRRHFDRIDGLQIYQGC